MDDTKTEILAHASAVMVYSTAGAMMEHLSYALARQLNPKDHQVKLLKNPVLTGFPVYAMAAYSVVALEKSEWVRNAPVFVRFLLFALVISLLEVTVGLFVGAGSNGSTSDGVKSWDYSGTFMNWRGIINIRHFLGNGLLGLLVAFVHPHLIAGFKRFYAGM